MDDMTQRETIKLILSLFKGKEKPKIIHHLKQGPLRFNELKKVLDPISKKVLSQRLRDLEYIGFIKRTIYPDVPVRVEYSVTPLLQKAQPLFDEITIWENYYRQEYKKYILTSDLLLQDHPFDLILDMLGDKWKAEILYVLKDGKKRFGQIKKELYPISQKVLTQQLRSLEQSGFISRTIINDKTISVEYELTDLCSTLNKIGFEMMNYANYYKTWKEKNASTE